MFPTGLNKIWQRISNSLFQTSANTLEVYNGVNPQALNIYNRRSAAGNYERVSLNWLGDVFNLTSEALNGTQRNINFPANVIYTFGTKAGNFIIDLSQNDLRLRSSNGGYVVYLGNTLNVANGIAASTSSMFVCGKSAGEPYAGAVFRKDSANCGFDLFAGSSYSSLYAAGASSIAGANAYATATVNITGGAINITGGAGASSSSGAAHGGNVTITGGTGYGTGTKGIVTASRLRADGFATATAAKTADYTATLDDGTIEVDASGAARTITLFTTVGNAGKIIVVKKTDSSANAVTIDGNATETIDGAATVVLSTQWATVTLQVNAEGTAWFKI